jgi:hypothetical protein
MIRNPAQRLLPVFWLPPTGRAYLPARGRSVLNALDRSKDLGCIIVTHPYHPFKGKRFKILKIRKVSGIDTYIVQDSKQGTFAIPRDWTDHADPDPYDNLDIANPILSFHCLFLLVDLVEKKTRKKS